MIRNSRTFDRALSLITLMAIVMASFPVFPRVAEAASVTGLVELMPNPDNGVGDGNGEWLRVTNTGTSSLDITGWQIEDAQAFSYTFGSVILLPSDEYVVCANASTTLNGGITCDDEWGGGGTWNNGAGGDTLTLLDDSSVEVVSFSYTDPADEQIFSQAFSYDATPVPECSSEDDVDLTTFDTFSLASVNGQNDWSSTGPYDQEVVENTYGFEEFGCKSLRISNAVTTGAFGDQTFAAPTTGAAGESTVASNNHFEAQFDIASTMPELQSGLVLSVSPDDGNGSRMSYLSFTDTADGIDVVFYDVTNAGPFPSTTTWNATEVATLDRDESHTIKFVMDFVDGPANDVVKIYINNVLVHTGTSWEDYYRYDSEQTGNGNALFPVDTLIFRAGGTAVPANDENGFLFDNMSLLVSEGEPDTKVLVDVLVTPSDLIEAADVPTMYDEQESWFFYNDETDTIDNTLGSFVDGPDTAPLGDGSVEISVSGTQRRNLATYQFSGTKLEDITDLEFSTYNPSAGNGGSSDRSAYLNFNVDFTGADTWQKRLVYLPSQNGTVDQNDWQEWDAIDGGDALWSWSGFAANGNKWPDNNTNEYRTWDDLLASFPNIAVRTTDSWLGLRVGEPYSDGYTENIDKFVIGIDTGTTTTITTYDFDPEQTSTVEICKMNEDRDRLYGWTLMLLGDKVETVNVPSTGTEVFSANNLDGDYAFIANGSYIYRPGYMGSTTDAAYSMRTDGNDPIDPTGHPFDPWVRVNDFNSPYQGYLGITVDGALGATDWGNIFNPLHEYALQYNGEGTPAGFKIVDSAYGDNSGSLTVDIYEGYVDVTGEDGCVTFEDVPYGDYVVDEIMKDGWFNVSGLGKVTVDGEEETFNVVNTDEAPQPTSSVQICKIDESETALPGWTLMLRGDEVDDLEVPANTMAGVDSTSLEGGMSYLAHVSGTWLNNREPDNHVDAEYSTEDGWATYMDGFTGYGANILELQVAENFMNWGAYNEDHEYTASFVPGTDGPVNFRIFDGNDPTPEAGWYADNSGSLDVTIEEGYVGVTGDTGCVTFENVPYGTYEVDEIMQEGWSNISGLDEVIVDGEEEVFTVKNQTPEPPRMCSVTVVSDEDNEVEETGDNAVEAWAHAAWTAIIDGAEWIWGSEYVTNPAVTEVQTFVKEFEWSGGVASSSLVIATDNYYEVYLNGDFVASSTENSLFTDANKDTIDVSSFVEVGNNTLEIKVTNLGVPGSSPTSNPAGLKYNLTVVSDETGEDCMFAPEADLEITRPETEDQVLSGEYTFEAEYVDADSDADPVQWAIRAGTCNSGSSNIVAGNVDQFSGASSTPYMWNGASFSSTIDMSDWEEGKYCFVVNPTEDSAPYFRETRWFTLEHPEPTQCLIVSDTSTLVVDNNDFAVETWDEHNNWTHDINGATWIWDSFYVEDPEATTTRTFKETFNVTEVGAAELDIAADNTYTVYINGDQVVERLNANNYQTPDEYDVTSFIDEGDNELEIIVTNIGTDDSIAKSNPAGLLFRLEIETDGGQCLSTTEPDEGEPEPTPTYEVFGFAWDDENENGIKDEDESYLPGVSVTIGNGTTSAATTTDAGGRYYFMSTPGSWTLSAVLSDWNLTYPDTDDGNHEVTVVATTTGAFDFGFNEDSGGGGGGSRTAGNDDDGNDGPDGQVAGTSTTFGVGGGIDLWEDLRNEIGNSGGPFGSVLGATAEAQELDATTTIEVGDDEATPSEDDEENTSAPWKNWLCDYLWLLPLLWIIVSALAYWRKESYEDPRAMLWTQIIFGAVAFILLVTYFIWEVPCAWVPSAIVAIGSAVMSYYGKE